MKTTVELSDALMSELKTHARKRGTTMREVLEAALRIYLDERTEPESFRMRTHIFRGNGPASMIYSPPTPTADALEQLECWFESSTLTAIGEHGARYFIYLRHILTASQATGPRVHDARIAAICLAHDVEELWSADRDPLV